MPVATPRMPLDLADPSSATRRPPMPYDGGTAPMQPGIPQEIAGMAPPGISSDSPVGFGSMPVKFSGGPLVLAAGVAQLINRPGNHIFLAVEPPGVVGGTERIELEFDDNPAIFIWNWTANRHMSLSGFSFRRVKVTAFNSGATVRFVVFTGPVQITF